MSIDRRYNELAGRSVDRLAGISDGVFAVGMTLLVLTLAIPSFRSAASDGDLVTALWGLGPSLLIYAMSFMTLGIFWVGQQTQLNQLAESNRHYTWIQLVFLFAVTLVPFSTQLLAHYSTSKVALVEYWLNIVLLGFMLLAGLEYGLRAHLFPEERRREIGRLLRGRILIAQVLYAVAASVSVFSVTLSIVLIILIQLNYVLAPRLPFLDRF